MHRSFDRVCEGNEPEWNLRSLIVVPMTASHA
jgi:hypothetical protein